MINNLSELDLKKIKVSDDTSKIGQTKTWSIYLFNMYLISFVENKIHGVQIIE